LILLLTFNIPLNIRPNWESISSRVHVAIIPAGSGNALARAILCDNVQAAAFNLIKGESRAIDLMSAENSEEKRFSFLSLTYALVADADYESEKFRWAGGARFVISAAARLINLRTYPLKLAYLPYTPPQPEEAGKVEIKYGFNEFNIDNLDVKWEKLEGEFTFLIMMNSPFVSSDTCMAPYSSLTDGAIDIVYIKSTSNLDLIPLFLKDLESGEAFAKDPLITHVKAKALYLKPATDKGVLMLDGEKLPVIPIKLEIHHKVLSLVAPHDVKFPLFTKQ